MKVFAKLQRGLGILMTAMVIVLACRICFSYIGVTRSEGYRFATRFIRQDPTVARNLGRIERMRLAFPGYSLNLRGTEVRGAQFKIYVAGQNRRGTVYLKVDNLTGEWKVNKGNLVLDKGRIVPLHESSSRAHTASWTAKPAAAAAEREGSRQGALRDQPASDTA
jgi:hypothetical protein